MAIQTTQTKASNATGSTPPLKKGGYASGGPDPVVRAAKAGKTNHKGYSGPNVAMPDKSF